MRKKHLRAAALLLCALLLSASITGCAKDADTGNDTGDSSGSSVTSSEPGVTGGDTDAGETTAADTAAAGAPTLDLQTQYYDEEGNVIQIPIFKGENNAAVDALNSRIDAELIDFYSTLTLPDETGATFQIKTYLNNGDKYLQALVTVTESPWYGSDGSIFSYVYDLTSGKEISAADAVTLSGKTEKEITDKIAAYTDETKTGDQTLGTVKLAAFELPTDNIVSLYYYVEIKSVESTDWTYIYTVRITGKKDIEVTPLFNRGQSVPETEPVTDAPVTEAPPEPDKVDTSTKPTQSDLSAGEVNAYTDKSSGIKITFPKAFSVQLAYEDGYAAFTDSANTDSIVYLVEDGSYSEITKADNSAYLRATESDGTLVFERAYTSYTERCYVRELGGKTVWVILNYTSKSASAYAYKSGDITIKEG